MVMNERLKLGSGEAAVTVVFWIKATADCGGMTTGPYSSSPTRTDI
jgi:hypothetical protein